MNKLQFDFIEGVTFRLARAESDVVIKGGHEGSVELILDGDADQYVARMEGQELVVETHVALSVTVPCAAIVQVDHVMGDLKGPGVLWRTWSAKAGAGHIKVFLDGNETPVID